MEKAILTRRVITEKTTQEPHRLHTTARVMTMILPSERSQGFRRRTTLPEVQGICFKSDKLSTEKEAKETVRFAVT